MSTLINNMLFTKKLLPLIWVGSMPVISMKSKPMHNNWLGRSGGGDWVMGQEKWGRVLGLGVDQ